MNEDFIKRCDSELTTNVAKGKWKSWKPNVKELSQELSWHVAKLNQRLLNGDVDGVKELSADVANICEKAFTQAMNAKKNRKEERDFYGDFVGWNYGPFVKYDDHK